MRFAAVLFTVISLALPAGAQKLDLKFDNLAAKATDKAEVDLDGRPLKMALQAGAMAEGFKGREETDRPAGRGAGSPCPALRIR